MVNITQYGGFKPLGRYKGKRQIILCHTSREAEEYLVSLKIRYNQKYDRIPHYLITKSGDIIQLIIDSGHTNFFEDDGVNRQSIIISLENLGWLEKKPLTNQYINWKGGIYIEEPYEKKWRDYFFWEPYTESQVDSVIKLCNKLCYDFSIEKKCSGHNTKISGIKNFEGIVSRSNYDERFTDLNPSFDFEKLIKNIEHEQIP
jgi:N-acetyl-anhydromuramyl-L-alanine amidase AmpD